MTTECWDMMEGTLPTILAVEPTCPKCQYTKIFIGDSTDDLDEQMTETGWNFTRKRSEYKINDCGCQK